MVTSVMSADLEATPALTSPCTLSSNADSLLEVFVVFCCDVVWCECLCGRARPAPACVRACVRAYLEEASARVEVAFETRRIDFIFNETSLCVRMCVRARKAVSVRVLYTTRERGGNRR